MRQRQVNGSVRPEYWVWRDIKQRCLNPKNQAYRNYGGRGIRVAVKWLSFEGFFADMGSRPSSNHTIERKDNDGDYCASNCVWIPRAQQQDNTRQCQRTTMNGETHSTAEWCRRLGLSYRTVQQRIGRYGWDAVVALTTPTIKGKAHYAHR